MRICSHFSRGLVGFCARQSAFICVHRRLMPFFVFLVPFVVEDLLPRLNHSLLSNLSSRFLPNPLQNQNICANIGSEFVENPPQLLSTLYFQHSFYSLMASFIPHSYVRTLPIV